MIIQLKHRALTSDQLVANEECRKNVLRGLNILIKDAFRSFNYIDLGRLQKYYDQNDISERDLQGTRVYLFKGFKTAFEVYASGVKLLVNYNTRIVRQKTLYEEYLDRKQQGQSDESIAEELIYKRSVLTTYGNHKLYVIDGVEWNMRPTDAFPNKEFKNYMDYFQKRYKVDVRFKDQFVLLSIQKVRQPDRTFRQEKIYLLPELVRATGLTDEMRSNFKIMQALSKDTIKNPHERFSLTDDIVDKLNERIAKNSNKSIFVEMNKNTAVPGLVMPPPQITGRNGANFAIKNDRIDVGQISEPFKLTNWILVYEKFTEENSHTVIDNFFKACKRYQIQFTDANDYIDLNREKNAQKLLERIGKSRCPNPTLVMFFVTKKTSQVRFYSDVKRAFDKRGIVTQFFTSFNPHKDSQGLAKYSNILLQMALKCKQNLWSIDSQLKDTLILGADVCHGAKNSSVAAVVGLFGGSTLTQSYSACAIQNKNQEIMNSVAKMVLEITEHY